MNIYHIHIGKCAGGSFNKTLMRKRIKFQQGHCGNSNIEIKERILNQNPDDYFVITLRDPIDRFVSSFNFDKYEKTIERKCKNALWSKIYEEFNSVNELVEAFLSENIKRQSLAFRTVFNSNLHIHMGLSWYLDFETILKLPLDRTSIIRTEYFNADFKKFSDKLGLEISQEDFVFDKSSSGFLKFL
ncbi:MAG: sulfotransferase family 2 domain-containing protein, partial [Bacteroidales bacterium]|nr:sulfotransferase family 2 domain-containing protein [Bacteroidales bacterium]